MIPNKKLIGIILLVLVKNTVSLGEYESFSSLLNMVESNISAANKYTIPQNNAKLLKVVNPVVKEFGEYDFIVVGAGVGGAAVANRLSEIENWNVLVLEAGGQDNDFSKIYGLSNSLLYSDFNWGYNTTPQEHHCLGMVDRKCYLHHGKVIGGSTTIYGGTYARGHHEDYDRWVNVYKNPGWSFNEILPYFKKSENAVFEPRDEAYHGKNGYITIDYTPPTPGLINTLVGAFHEIGLNYTDYNGANHIGVSRPQLALKGNERDSSAAFLRISRSNLNISLNSFVTKVLIGRRDKKAYGVKFVKDGTVYVARARKEVIISGGGFNSPQILMLSGIGPRCHLRKLNIPVIKNLPVGQYFQTHVNYIGIVMRTNKTRYNLTLEEQLKRFVDHLKPLTNGNELLGFTNFGQNKSVRPQVEFWFNAPASSGSGQKRYYGLTDAYAKAYNTNTITDLTVMLTVLHPKSRGSITLKSNSPVDKPLINPNCLAAEEDIETMYKGIQLIYELNKSKAFEQYGAKIDALDSPGCTDEKLSKAWWICSIKHYAVSANHPVAANLMGPNEKTSVVNHKLQVHGIGNLRVVDASVIPEVNSGHTMAPAMMLAEKASDIIKKDYGVL